MSTSDEASGMDTGELDPAIASIIEPHRPTPPRRGFRPSARQRLVLIASALVLSSAAFVLAGILNYQPVTLWHGHSWGGDPDGCVERVEVRAPRTGEAFDLIRISCPAGTRVTWTEPLANEGPVSLTVTGIEVPAIDPFDALQIRLGSGVATDPWRGPDHDAWESLPEFAPFVLAPGEFQAIVYRATVGSDCEDETRLVAFGLRYSVLGVPRQDRVPHAVVPSIHCLSA